MPDQPKPITISRKELYRRVWSTPVSILAAEFGVSDRGLAKICERYEIPVPPRGYWAKRAAGKKVVQFRLPELGGGKQEIYIAPTPAPESPEQLSQHIQEMVAKAKSHAPIAVPETLRSPHPVIEAWLKENAEEIERGRKWNSYVPATINKTPLDRRRLRILDALFKAAPLYGLKVERDGQRTYDVHFVALEEKIGFSLTEKVQRNRHKLTDAERAERYSTSTRYKFTETATGRLDFRITTELFSNAVKTRWTETPERPLEQSLNEILVAVSAGVSLLHERTLAQRRQQQKEWAEQRKRWDREKLEKTELNRWKHVLDMATRSQQARIARRFIVRLEQLALAQAEGGELSARNKDWFAWAQDRLHEEDPLNYRVTDLINQNLEATEYTRPMQWAVSKE